MKKSGMRSGGGIGMGVTKSGRAGGKVEPVSNKGFPSGVAQMGAATAFRKEPILKIGAGYHPQKQGDAGSRSYYNSAKEGPGSGRTIFKAGTQSASPQAKPLPKGPDFLKQFGPERKIGE